MAKARRRIYSCQVCDEVFVDVLSLERHLRSHGGNQPTRIQRAWNRLSPALLMGLTLLSLALFTTSLYWGQRFDLSGPQRALQLSGCSVIEDLLPGVPYRLEVGTVSASLTIYAPPDEQLVAMNALSHLWGPANLPLQVLPGRPTPDLSRFFYHATGFFGLSLLLCLYTGTAKAAVALRRRVRVLRILRAGCKLSLAAVAVWALFHYPLLALLGLPQVYRWVRHKRLTGSRVINGPQEAAIVLLSFPPERTALIFQELGEEEVQRLTIGRYR